MAQMNFAQNLFAPTNLFMAISDGTLSFQPLNIYDSVSLNNLNLWATFSSVNQTHSLYAGLYSLNGSSLSIINSLSITISKSNSARQYLSFSNTSATQNITPGTWWWGLLVRTAGNNGISLLVGGNSTSNLNADNAFPGSFIGGRMTVSTSVLPSSIATSDLDITGQDAMVNPWIIISA